MNQTKTLFIIIAMTGLLVWIGGMVGGRSGMVMALALGLVLNGVSYFFSDKIVLASYGAQPVTPAEAPELHAIVANLAQRAGLPMPRIAIIPDDTPNAFATLPTSLAKPILVACQVLDTYLTISATAGTTTWTGACTLA